MDTTGSGDSAQGRRMITAWHTRMCQDWQAKCQTTLTGVAVVQIKEDLDLNTVIPAMRRMVPGLSPPTDTKVSGCSSVLYKTA